MLPEGSGVELWRKAYLDYIDVAGSLKELQEWNRLNEDILVNKIHKKYPEVSAEIFAYVERKIDQIEFRERQTDKPDTNFGMPKPKDNPTGAINWIAAKLQEFNTYEAAENFWNSVVAPREKEFDRLDFENLEAEWKRTEARFGGSRQVS